jgi:hypothetical protein
MVIVRYAESKAPSVYLLKAAALMNISPKLVTDSWGASVREWQITL